MKINAGYLKYIFSGIIASFVVNGCGGKSDEEYLKEAELKMKENKRTEAVQLYEKIIGEYPESQNAPEALYQLAALYQNKMVPDITEYESLRKSSELYKSLYEKYPENEKAPKSLFMSAFIQANDLRKFDEATKTYKLFLQKYPDHELAGSAKEELDHMGLSPDEILKKKDDVNI